MTAEPGPTRSTLATVLDAQGDSAVAVETSHEVTPYGRLRQDALAFARALIGAGLHPGDTVGVLLPNGADFVTAVLGTAMAGGVVVPVNTRYRDSELPHVLTDAGVRVLVTSDEMDGLVDLVGLVLAALGEVPEPGPTVVLLGRRRTPAALDRAAFLALGGSVDDAAVRRAAASRSEDDVALILYTSGTTSSPTGCLLTHRALMGGWGYVRDRLVLRRGERVWIPCPFFHVAGIGPMVMALGAGATVVTAGRFDADTSAATLRERPADVLWPAYPPIVEGVLTASGRQSLHGARAMLVVAQPNELAAFEARAGVPVFTLYGMTEGACGITFTWPDEPAAQRLGDCGLPIPEVELNVLRADGSLAASGRGELLVRGRQIMRRYHAQPDRTAVTIDEDGWFHTGDDVTVDQAGRLRFHGRLKETLKVGGENVSPAEVEAFVTQHPAVRLAQVVGAPDPRLGQVVALFVELRAGRTADAAELVAFCSGRMASFKVPRHVRFVTDWPMSSTKIQRAPLAAAIAAELEGTR